MKVMRILCLGLLGLSTLGCADNVSGSERQLVGVPLPPGDHERGREVFRSEGCRLCHGATGEVSFPEPVSVTPAPEIGLPQANWSTSEIATAIVDPSHRFTPERLEDAQPRSSMLDYSEELTLGELADLLAYIRYLGR